MDAWTGDPIPVRFISGLPPLQLQGALVFQYKQCHNCHALGDIGGKRGPALDAVAVRLTGDQLVRQVLQGGGNMPAYGKNLNPAETTAPGDLIERSSLASEDCRTRPPRDPRRARIPEFSGGQRPPAARRPGWGAGAFGFLYCPEKMIVGRNGTVFVVAGLGYNISKIKSRCRQLLCVSGGKGDLLDRPGPELSLFDFNKSASKSLTVRRHGSLLRERSNRHRLPT